MMAPIKTLDVFPKSMMDEWEKNGIYYMKNNRTGQALPQGPEFLSEIKASGVIWNVERVIKETRTRYLLVHGAEDKDVPLEHSETLKAWAEEEGHAVTLRVIEGAGHTFNTVHPFKCRTPELDAAIEILRDGSVGGRKLLRSAKNVTLPVLRPSRRMSPLSLTARANTHITIPPSNRSPGSCRAFRRYITSCRRNSAVASSFSAVRRKSANAASASRWISWDWKMGTICRAKFLTSAMRP